MIRNLDRTILLCVFLPVLALGLDGLVLCFRASVVIGIFCLFTGGAVFPIESIAYLLSGYDIALHIAHGLGLS